MPKHKSGYLLPPEALIETPDTVCVQFTMPNTQEYRQAMMGQIFELCKWWAWDKGGKGDTRATRAAHMFRDTVFQSIKFLETCPQGGEEMPFDIRVNGCMLEKSEDNGVTWQDVFDLTECNPPPIVFSQVDCTLTADGVTIFDASCATPEPEPEPDPDPEIPPQTEGNDGSDKRCDLATYLVDIPLPSQAQQLIALREAEANAYNLAAAIAAIPAVVAGVIITGGVAIPAYLISAAAISAASGGAASVYAVTLEMDTAATSAELTPQFWQDVKCIIYCTLLGEARLTQDIVTQIHDNILTELLTQYPNAAPLIAAMFISWSEETRGLYTSTGALYTGSNCNLCTCPEWSENVISHDKHGDPQTPYVTTENMTEAVVAGAPIWIADGAGVTMSVLIDISRVQDTEIVRIAGGNQVTQGFFESGAKTQVWQYDKINGAQILVFEQDNGSGVSPYSWTTGELSGKKFRVDIQTYYGWSDNVLSRIGNITVYGRKNEPEWIPST